MPICPASRVSIQVRAALVTHQRGWYPFLLPSASLSLLFLQVYLLGLCQAPTLSLGVPFSLPYSLGMLQDRIFCSLWACNEGLTMTGPTLESRDILYFLPSVCLLTPSHNPDVCLPSLSSGLGPLTQEGAQARN